MNPEKKLKSIQKKMDAFSEKFENEIRSLCEVMQYQDSSRFSYNIDRIRKLQEEINNFEILNR